MTMMFLLSVMSTTKTIHSFIRDSQFGLSKMFLSLVFVNDVNDMFVKCIVVGPRHGKKITKYLKQR